MISVSSITQSRRYLSSFGDQGNRSFLRSDFDCSDKDIRTGIARSPGSYALLMALRRAIPASVCEKSAPALLLLYITRRFTPFSIDSSTAEKHPYCGTQSKYLLN